MRYIVVDGWKMDRRGQPVMQWGDPLSPPDEQFYFAGPFDNCKDSIQTFTLEQARRLVKQHYKHRKRRRFEKDRLVIVKLRGVK